MHNTLYTVVESSRDICCMVSRIGGLVGPGSSVWDLGSGVGDMACRVRVRERERGRGRRGGESCVSLGSWVRLDISVYDGMVSS